MIVTCGVRLNGDFGELIVNNKQGRGFFPLYFALIKIYRMNIINFFDYIKAEWLVIKKAPFSFIFIIIICSISSYYVWFYL